MDFFFNNNKGIPTSDYKREGDTNSQEPCPPPSSSERIKYIAQFFFFTEQIHCTSLCIKI